MPEPGSRHEPRWSAAEIEAFFARPVAEVAPDLLGSEVVCGHVRLLLTEVEAYAGLADPASHSYRGRTSRNAVMFGPPGRVYVYLSYGVHWAVNLVCQGDGDPAAVLLRAGRVLSGHDRARAHRGDVPDHRLARGPGNLTSALGVNGPMTGTTLWSGPMRWQPSPREAAVAEVRSGPRVGVSLAADVEWRFWLAGDDTVSSYRRSTRA